MTDNFIRLMQAEVEKLLMPEAREVSKWRGAWDNTVRIAEADLSLSHCIDMIAMSYKGFDGCKFAVKCHGFGNNVRQYNGKVVCGLEVWCNSPEVNVDAILKAFISDLPKLVEPLFGEKVWSKQNAVSCLEESEYKDKTGCLVLANNIKEQGDGAVFYVADFPREMLNKIFSAYNYAPVLETFFRRFVRHMNMFQGEKKEDVDFEALSPTRVCVLLPNEFEQEFCSIFRHK